MTAPVAKRRGRPPKSADPATKDRLLEAAAQACVADGFESVTLAGIAERAGVTATAIYNHFVSREELLYAAGRRALDELAASLAPEDDGGLRAVPTGADAIRDIAAAYLRPDMAPTRRLFLELHLAGGRHPDLAAHLDDWHREFAKTVADLGPVDDDAPGATVKTLFMLLLGLCHLEDLDALRATPKATLERVERLVDALFPEERTVNEDIRAWVESELGVVRSVSAIGSGASREIWRVETDAGPMVVRVDTGTGPVAGTALDLAREAVVYGALRDSGLPVPRLRAVEPGGRALLMDLADGSEALGAVADAERRGAISRDYLAWLGRLHRLDPSALDLPGWVHPADGPDHTLLDLDLWSSICDERAAGWTAPPTPFALGWLGSQAPATASGTSLCHGDAGPGNFLYGDHAVTAMLDWEFAHLGDPHDDLAWVAVRNHLLGRPMDVPDAYRSWEAVTGIAVEPDRLEYYRVFVLVRMAISCDATIAWKDGVEDDSIRTQVLLRPWLATALATALELAGCDDPGLPALQQGAEAALAASPHAALLAMIPPLEPLEGT